MISTMQKRQRRATRNKYRLLQNNLSNRPLLCIFISNDNIYAQVQQKGQTLASANTLKMEGTRKKTNKYFASLVGKEIAQKALDKNINSVVFDRGYRQFNAEGKLGAFVNSARNAGLCI